jgi:hypothetical protein
MSSSFLLDSRLPVPELMAARLDREVAAVGRSFSPADLPSTPELRAAALAIDLPAAVVVEAGAAAWVHGVLPAPWRVVAGRAVSIRPAAGCSTVVVRQVVYPDDDVVTIGSVRVTSARRTALDLARAAPTLDLRTATAVATLLQRSGVPPAHARRALEGRRGMPYRARVLARLTAIERLVSPP